MLSTTYTIGTEIWFCDNQNNGHQGRITAVDNDASVLTVESDGQSYRISPNVCYANKEEYLRHVVNRLSAKREAKAPVHPDTYEQDEQLLRKLLHFADIDYRKDDLQ